MNVDPLSRNKLFKLVVIICCDSKNLTKKYMIIDLRLKIRKVKFMFTYLLSEIILF